jgi:hypothetical protein
MSLIDWLVGRAKNTDSGSDTDTVRRIVAQLNGLDPVRARHLAAFAYVLSRVANADLNISDVETKKMIEILQKLGGLPEEQPCSSLKSPTVRTGCSVEPKTFW